MSIWVTRVFIDAVQVWIRGLFVSNESFVDRVMKVVPISYGMGLSLRCIYVWGGGNVLPGASFFWTTDAIR